MVAQEDSRSTSNMSDSINSDSSNSSETQPRRSSRLQQKRLFEGESNENERNKRTKTRTDSERDEGNSQSIPSTTASTSRSTLNTDNSSTANLNTSTNTNTNTRTSRSFNARISSSSTTRSSPFPFDPSSPFLSFTFTFENGQLVPSGGNSTALPAELQNILLSQMNSTARGGTVIGVTGMAVPIGMSTVINGNLTDPQSQSQSQTQTQSQTQSQVQQDDFLNLSRQLIQIIFRARLGDPTAEPEIETILGDFMTRIFGASASSAPAGLSTERISNLPDVEQDALEFDCSICRDTARPANEKCVQLPCKHCFHYDCIEPWLTRVASCPICRKIIE